MYRLSAAHAAFASLLLLDGVQGFSFAPSFIPKCSLLHPSCNAGGHSSALGLGMVMTSSSKADTTKKVPEVPDVPSVPGAKVDSSLDSEHLHMSHLVPCFVCDAHGDKWRCTPWSLLHCSPGLRDMSVDVFPHRYIHVRIFHLAVHVTFFFLLAWRFAEAGRGC